MANNVSCNYNCKPLLVRVMRRVSFSCSQVPPGNAYAEAQNAERFGNAVSEVKPRSE